MKPVVDVDRSLLIKVTSLVIYEMEWRSDVMSFFKTILLLSLHKPLGPIHNHRLSFDRRKKNCNNHAAKSLTLNEMLGNFFAFLMIRTKIKLETFGLCLFLKCPNGVLYIYDVQSNFKSGFTGQGQCVL